MIDAHIHVVPPNLPGVGPLADVLTLAPESIAVALRGELRGTGIERVLAMPEWGTPPEDPLGIARTSRIAELAPEIALIGLADPTRGDDPDHLARVERDLAARRVVALKCYLGYLFYEPAHANYRKYYELAERYRIPVIFHTGDPYSTRAKIKYAHPLGVDEVAVDHPRVNFVLAHIGYPWTIDAAEVIYKNLNVWGDLSGLVVGNGGDLDPPSREVADVKEAVRRVFRYAERPNRFIFGSDWPLIPIGPYRDFMKQLVPREQMDDVFRDNARRLFRL